MQRAVAASDPFRGRPRGLPSARNRLPANMNRTEVIDYDKCPVCDGELLRVTDGYGRVVKHARVFRDRKI